MIAAIIILCGLAISLGSDIARHGQPKEGVHNAWVDLIATVIVLGLYYWAGLFDVFKIGG